jgi:hypothetical protein
MKDFIKKHQKLVGFVFIIIVLIFAVLVFISVTTTNPNTGPFVDKDTQSADNDAGNPIQYVTPLYTLTADPNAPQNMSITAYSGYRNAAVNIIYQFGLNPTDYKITFTYESPFKIYE